MRNLFRLFASLWNGAVHTVLRLAEGRDWNLLFKVTISSIFWQSVFLYVFFETWTLFCHVFRQHSCICNCLTFLEYCNRSTQFWFLVCDRCQLRISQKLLVLIANTTDLVDSAWYSMVVLCRSACYFHFTLSQWMMNLC